MGQSYSKTHTTQPPYPPAFRLPAEREGESEIIRSGKTRELVTRYWDDVGTLFENFQRGVRNFPESNCIGWRSKDTTYQWLTYAQVDRRMRCLGSGLLQMELQAGSFVGIYSINRPEWVITEQACNAFSMPVVPLYDTLGFDACKFIIQQTELPIIFCSANKTSVILGIVEQCPSLKYIVQFDAVDQELKERGAFLGVRILYFEEVVVLGKQNVYDPIPPSPNDLATICYTSGTTGDPKGVMLTHGNIIADSAGVFTHGVHFSPHDVHLSYLPLAHMLERVIQTSLWGWGVSVGFFLGDVTKIMDDLEALKPTIFPSVPRLFNRIYQSVWSSVEETGGVKKSLFRSGYRTKKANLSKGKLTHTVWDRVVFRKIAEKLGGRVEVMLSGSAPISPDVMEFLRICFSCPVVEGYGQTESVAASCIQSLLDPKVGNVGPPIPCNEAKLVDVPEMGYYSSDKPFPRGELCLRGANIFKGYFKMPLEKTKEVLEEDGWLHTGDIASIDEYGNVKIIDRKKNLFKLAQGEYISPEKLEQAFVLSPFIAQCFVYGDSLESYLVAIVVPNEEAARKWARSRNLDEPLTVLCGMEDFQQEVFASMQRIQQDAHFQGFECVKRIYLNPHLFTIENETLTPTLKLKRQKIQQAFQPQIDQMYGRDGRAHIR